MKRSIFSALLLILAGAAGIRAQEEFSSARLENAAGELKRSTAELVDRTAEGLRRGSSNTREVIEEAFLAHQLDSSAELFRRMIDGRRRASELRDGAAILTELARSVSSYTTNRALWSGVETAINNINHELGNPEGTGDDGENPENRQVIGRVFWRGTVDHHLALVIRERTIETRLLSGKGYPDGTYSFTTPLPARAVLVAVNKTKGRGTARVVQQPSKANDFTTIVEIMDGDGGAKEYQLDIFWK
jgi:hypothetical protein